MFERAIDIRWSDLDPLGHVNNAAYATYLEEARDRWLIRALDGMTPIEQFVLAHIAIDYRAELVLADETVTATCEALQIGNSSFTTVETIVKRDGTVAASCEAVTVARDPATGRSRPLRDDERAALERELGDQPPRTGDSA